MHRITATLLAQFLFWIASVAFAAGTYFHTQSTVNDRVRIVETTSETNSKLICYIAIDLGIEKAKNICTLSVLK